jgi:S-adenosylmethionine:tRNA ribosyltransferase-isomerase
MSMRLDAFDYHLPRRLIAQAPLPDRDASRLMVVDRETGRFEHRTFRELPRCLDPGDVLVVNRSRVIPARLRMRRRTGARVELFVTRVIEAREFVALANPIKRTRPGDVLMAEDGAFSCYIIDRHNDREVLVAVAPPHTVDGVLETHGHVPLPPYIDRADEPYDRERYQTVFADEKGSVAAPTAGLHFTDALLDELREKGIEVWSVVLHVSLGTFLPLQSDTVEDNKLCEEHFLIEGVTLESIRRAKDAGRGVVAVGTTAARVLETAWNRGFFEEIDPRKDRAGETDLFIYPGYEFRCVDRLVTNFHLPKSSLLLLVCSFLGTDNTLACYREAVGEKYRFYSYGDAMLIR